MGGLQAVRPAVQTKHNSLAVEPASSGEACVSRSEGENVLNSITFFHKSALLALVHGVAPSTVHPSGTPQLRNLALNPTSFVGIDEAIQRLPCGAGSCTSARLVEDRYTAC